jgi:hypothetical protein
MHKKALEQESLSLPRQLEKWRFSGYSCSAYYFCSVSIRGESMGMPVRIDDTLYAQARAQAQAERRTIAGQIEFWAMVGKAALDNPDLPIDFVRELLIARAEGPALATAFIAEGQRD